MKAIRRVFFILILFCNTQVARTQAATAGSLIYKLFASLKNKDERAFVALCPDSSQLVQIMKSIEANVKAKFDAERKAWQEKNKNFYHHASSSDKTDSVMFSLLQKNYSPEEIQKIIERYAANFRYMIEKGEKRGIHWKDATLTNYTYDTIQSNQQSSLSFFSQSGYPVAHGIFHFNGGDTTYQMSFTEMIFLPDEKRWYGATLMRLAHEGEPLESDREGFEVTTVELVSIEKDEPPPPPPPPPKPKTKNKRFSVKKNRLPKS